jgi:hypothetical protein
MAEQAPNHEELRVPHPRAQLAQGRERHAASRPFGRGAIALAILCACMVFFAATLRVAHSHTTAEQESGHCPICIAIHTGMPAASTPIQICLHAAPEPIVTPTPQAPARVRVEALSDRAPPVNV